MNDKRFLLGPTLKVCLIWVLVCLAIASLSGWVTSLNIHPWYESIAKPAFTPPNWLFGPVWTVLYIMIGVSGGLLWQTRKVHSRAFVFFSLQLFFNFMWSFIFFGAHQIYAGMADILLTFIFLLATLCFSYKASKLAFWLLMPYFVWLSFALVLNASIGVLS
jgi:translocator protein